MPRSSTGGIQGFSLFFSKMNRTVWLFGIMLAGRVLLGSGCLGDAPHDNPLDPDSDRFVDEGGVEGRVTDRAEAPLAGVEVRLVPGSSVSVPELVTRTDSQGRFRLVGVPGGADYQLQALKEGYAAGSLDALAVRAGFAEQLPTIRLNALPIFRQTTLRTIHISRWWPQNDLFFLEINAEVQDADGLFDIDDVWFEIPDLGFTVAMDLQAAGQFDKLIEADSLPAANLQSLLGRSLRVHVRDAEGGVVSSTPQQLVRVLETTPAPTAPRDDVLLAVDQPTLTWDPFPARFAFTYRVDLFRAEVNRDVLVLQSDPIPLDVTTFAVTTPLPTGPYFWTLTVVDAFGNQSRSKEAAFRIP